MPKFAQNEKFQAVLVTVAILAVVIGLLHREPQPKVYFTLDKATAQKQCVKVVRMDRQGNEASYPCSSIDLENDSYEPIDVMGEDEIEELASARR